MKTIFLDKFKMKCCDRCYIWQTVDGGFDKDSNICKCCIFWYGDTENLVPRNKKAKNIKT